MVYKALLRNSDTSNVLAIEARDPDRAEAVAKSERSQRRAEIFGNVLGAAETFSQELSVAQARGGSADAQKTDTLFDAGGSKRLFMQYSLPEYAGDEVSGRKTEGVCWVLLVPETDPGSGLGALVQAFAHRSVHM